MELHLFNADCREISSRSKNFGFEEGLIFFLQCRLNHPAFTANSSWFVSVVFGKIECFYVTVMVVRITFKINDLSRFHSIYLLPADIYRFLDLRLGGIISFSLVFDLWDFWLVQKNHEGTVSVF